jgi:hypothetical protein
MCFFFIKDLINCLIISSIVFRPGLIIGLVQNPGFRFWPGCSGQIFFNQNDVVLVKKRRKVNRLQSGFWPDFAESTRSPGQLSFFFSCFFFNLARFQPRVDEVRDRPAGTGQILIIWSQVFSIHFRIPSWIFGFNKTIHIQIDHAFFLNNIFNKKINILKILYTF